MNEGNDTERQTPKVRKINPPKDDAKNGPSAEDESNAIDEGNYDELARKADHTRTEKVKDIIACLIKVSIILAFLFALWFLATWAMHILLPESVHYLEPHQIAKIQELLFTGMFTGLLAIIGNKLADKYLISK